MGLLPPDYYDKLSQEPSNYPSGASSATPIDQTQATPSIRIENPHQISFEGDTGQPVRMFGDLTPEQQTAKYGGEVGSPAYNDYKAKEGFTGYIGRELGSAIGLRFPDDATWDKMSPEDQILTTGRAAAASAGRMISDLPKALVGGVASATLTAIKPFYNIATGKPADAESLANEPVARAPWLGDIPTMYQSAKEAEGAGMGPVASKFFGGLNQVLNTTTLLPVAEVFSNTFRPMFQSGGKAIGTQATPAKFVVDNHGEYRSKVDSTNEYYTLTKTDAKKFGGTTNDVRWKVSPGSADGDAQSLSIIKALPQSTKVGSFVKTPFGLKKVEIGDHGPEVKLYSTDIKTSNNLVSDKGSNKSIGKETYMAPRTLLEADEMSTEALARFGDSAVKESIFFGGKTREFYRAPDSVLANPPGKTISDAIPIDNSRIFIEPAPKKGFENKPVDDTQLSTLRQITQVKGIDPSVSDAIMRTITGKTAAGELTQLEYTRVAKTLSEFGDKYSTEVTPTVGTKTFVKGIMSPQRHYADYVEDTYGIPYKSKIYAPLEEGTRLAKNLEISLKGEYGDLFGKYADSKYVEERRLIDGYLRGNTETILGNSAIDDATKGELVTVANNLRDFFNRTGPVLNVEKKAFIKDYLPNVQDLGGIFSRYKDLETSPGKDFFAKFKREGNLGTMIDDPLVSGQIYIREGARSLHMGRALEDAKSLIQAIPKEYDFVKKGINSYVQEKMGYQGRFEQFVDSLVPALNKNLPFDIPQDASRQTVNFLLSQMYSGLLSTPASWFKQSFQLPMFVYGRNGGKNLGAAMLKGFTKEGYDEVAKKGFLIDTVVPYGEALLKDTTTLGKGMNIYKDTTQKIISPMTKVDNNVRVITYHQVKLNWDEAWSKFSSGKITQTQFEHELDFNSLSGADRSIIRNALAQGDQEGAFNNFVREAIDETSFPYRQGSGARASYGLTGKLATGFVQYTIEATNVMARWVRSGQWDKVIRMAAGAQITNNTLQQTFGFDFSKSFSVIQQLGGIESPFVQMAISGLDLLNAFKSNNQQEINTAQADIVKTVKSTVIPGGTQTVNTTRFFKAYKQGQDGVFPIYDRYGKLIYEGDFNELFWTTLMNFPTNQKVDEANTYTNLKNAITDYNETKSQIDQLMREGNYDEMDKLIEKTGITPSTNVMQSSYVPRLQRLFQTAPNQVKGQFAPAVFK